MNLLFLNSAREWGGTEKWALMTANGLADRGHTVYFGCRGDLFEKHSRGKRIVFVKFPLANNADLVSVLKLRFFMRKRNIDVVLPSRQREYLLAGVAAKIMTNTKIAGMFGIDRPIHNLRNRIAFCWLFDMVLVVARKIIPTLSRTKGFDINKCRVVYVGVEPIERSPEDRKRYRKELGIGDEERVILGIGRLTPQKGFDYAIKAIARLAVRGANAKLVIVGGGDNAFYRQIALREGIAESVVFLGFRDDVRGLLQAADIFWLTSRSEGIPNTMLEAMAAKVPVVAFDIAGVAEVCNGSNSILVPYEDLDALVDATYTLIKDPSLRDRIGENGRDTVLKDFTIEKMCADTEKYLMELLQSRQSRKKSAARG
jgi:glycosyltransferase involved in cell wall biosynthesis